MEDLVTLPGVGRKTANVLLGHVFGQRAWWSTLMCGGWRIVLG